MTSIFRHATILCTMTEVQFDGDVGLNSDYTVSEIQKYILTTLVVRNLLSKIFLDVMPCSLAEVH